MTDNILDFISIKITRSPKKKLIKLNGWKECSKAKSRANIVVYRVPNFRGDPERKSLRAWRQKNQWREKKKKKEKEQKKN